MLTTEGQHFICPLDIGYLPYQRVILAFRGIFLTEKRVLSDMICCPSAVNKCPFKGHSNPYVVRIVWYLVISYLVPIECNVWLLLLYLWALSQRVMQKKIFSTYHFEYQYTVHYINVRNEKFKLNSFNNAFLDICISQYTEHPVFVLNKYSIVSEKVQLNKIRSIKIFNKLHFLKLLF